LTFIGLLVVLPITKFCFLEQRISNKNWRSKTEKISKHIAPISMDEIRVVDEDLFICLEKNHRFATSF
jgi:hypothetical protein